MVMHRPIDGTVKSCLISRSSTGKWFATFTVRQNVEEYSMSEAPAVGIDLGITNFLVDSNNHSEENPRFFRAEESQLKKAARAEDRRRKAQKLSAVNGKPVARIHERIANKRRNFAHQLSRKLVDANAVICVEDLDVNQMIHSACYAKSIHDAAWTQFIKFLEYKVAYTDKRVIKVNPAYTSQTCSSCGHRQLMPVAERQYLCPCCGLDISRDYNAALNILALGLQSIGIQPVEAQFNWE